MPLKILWKTPDHPFPEDAPTYRFEVFEKIGELIPFRHTTFWVGPPDVGPVQFLPKDEFDKQYGELVKKYGGWSTMENCALCGSELCPHSSQTTGIRTAIIECDKCGEAGLIGFCAVPNYCLPTYEGRVDWTSDVYSTVCTKCYFIHVEHECVGDDEPDPPVEQKQEQMQLFP